MSTSTLKATWTPAFHRIFVDLCVQETLKMKEPGTRISKEGWRNMVGSFYAKTGVRYDKKQFKNHYDSTRKLWKVWVKLTGDSSMKWDPETKKFGASEEDWHNYIKAIPEAAQFQSKEIQFKDKLDIIFDEGLRAAAIKNSPNLMWENDASDTSPLHGKEQEKKRKRVEDWRNYIKVFVAIPEAAQFRFKEIQFSAKLDIIFDGSIQTEEMRTSFARKRQNDASATSPLHVKVQEMKHKNVGTDLDYKNAILVHATPISTIASEPSMSSSSHPKIKATWTPSLHKIFLDLCLQETLKGNKPGTHFTKEGWKNIMESFYSQSGLNYDRLQLKNHWDSTKEQWKIWCKLICTGYMKWDPSNHKFEASEEDWTNYLQANPEAAQFHFKELQFTDILETIFNGTTVTGETEPAMQQRKSDDSVITFPLHAKEPDAASLDEKTECLCDAVASRNGVSIRKNVIAISSTEGKRNYSIGECIECLDTMEEIEQGSDLYLFALDVFLKQEYREIFLQLKKPNLRISWLQRLQSVGQPLL
ncbi:Myb/SANT-like domain [Sesbania bispinosa]|nr:Myb/SANT-like domain [Sesbania bispinosa]